MIVKEFYAKLGLILDAPSFERAQKALKTVGEGLVTLGALAVAGGAALGAMVISTANDAEKLERYSQRLGISTDKLQELGYAAAQSGVPLNQFADHLSQLAERSYQFIRGTGEAKQAFTDLGINIRDNKGQVKSLDTIFGELADKLSVMPDGTKKAGIIAQIFGDTGARLIPILNKGRDGLAALAQEARDLGLVMSEATVKTAAEAGRQWETLKYIFNGIKQTIANGVIPQLVEVVRAFLEWYKLNGKFVKQRMVKVFRLIWAVLKPLVAILGFLLKILGFIIDHMATLALILGGVLLAAIIMNTANLTVFIAAMIRVAAVAVWTGLRVAIAWAAANLPFIALAVLLTIMILLIEDIYYWVTGGDSVLGHMLGSFEDFIKKFTTWDGNDPWWLKAIKAAVIAVKALIESLEYVYNQAKRLTGGNAASIHLDRAMAIFDRGILRSGGAPIFDGGASSPAAAAALMPGATNQTVAPTFNTTVNIKDSQDPKETAKLVEKTIKDFWDNEVMGISFLKGSTP